METQNITGPSPTPLTAPAVTGPGEYPRVTMEAIEAEIVHENYFTAAEGVLGAWTNEPGRNDLPMTPAPLDLLTFCVLTLRNGFTVVGQSACADARNFNAEMGKNVAKEDAVRKIWPLLGFLLRDTLHQLNMVGNIEDTLGEALTRMLAMSFGNHDAFRDADVAAILNHFTKVHGMQPTD